MILLRAPCNSSSGLLLGQKVKVCSEIKVVFRNMLGFFIPSSLIWTVYCQFTWLAVHQKARRTQSSGHRWQGVWLLSPGFPHSWLWDWDLRNRCQGMTLENPPQCASWWFAWSFHQFRCLSVVKFKDYLNERINFFPMTLYLHVCFSAVGILSSCEL